MISIGQYHAGIYCGERLWRVRRWYKYYGLFRRVSTGFSLGPILFWKERI
jgi:hypothetical protein